MPDEDQAGLQPVADVLAALRRPAAAAELTGQASALAEFRAQPRRTAGAAQPRRRRGPVPSPLLRPRLALLFGSAAVLAGVAVGGYEGDLPGPVQQWAHHTFGLTAARSTASHRPARPSHRASSSHPPGTRQHQPAPAQHSRPEQGQQHGDSRHTPDRDGHHHHGSQGGPSPSPASGPSSSPSPSAPATPGPSTSPAAQPSAQSSSAPTPHRPRQTSSSAPSSPP